MEDMRACCTGVFAITQMRAARMAILMVLAATVISACQSPQAPAPAATNAPTSIPTAAPSGSANLVPPAAVAPSWKRFSDDEYHFTFQYPEACTVSESDGSFDVGGRIELTILGSDGLSLADFVKRFLDEKVKNEHWQIETSKTGALSGEEATTIEYRFGGTGRFGTATFALKDAKIYVWGLTAGGDTCGEPEAYDAVVSSFRFTR